MPENKQQDNKGNYASIGTENYKIPNCPFHLPKENAKFFDMMRKAAKDSYGQFGNYPNLQKNDLMD